MSEIECDCDPRDDDCWCGPEKDAAVELLRAIFGPPVENDEVGS